MSVCLVKTQCKFAKVLLTLLLLLGRGGSCAEEEQATAEAKAFAAIEENLPKMRAGRSNPTESDLEIRRKGSAEVIQAARQFLTNYPGSKKVEDAKSLIVIALYKGA